MVRNNNSRKVAAATFGKLTGLGFEKPVEKFFRTYPGEKSFNNQVDFY